MTAENFIPTFTTEDDSITEMLDEAAARANSDSDEKVTDNLNESVIGNYLTKIQRIEAILKGTSMDSQQLSKSLVEISKIL